MRSNYRPNVRGVQFDMPESKLALLYMSRAEVLQELRTRMCKADIHELPQIESNSLIRPQD